MKYIVSKVLFSQIGREQSVRGAVNSREQEALRILFKEGDRLGRARRAVAERLNVLLRAATDGLRHDALWQRGDALRLTRNSIFLEHEGATQADVIAAVAAALQRMRISSGANRLETAYPHITVIDSDDYFKTFNDVILQLAILRAAHRRELERWSDGDEERHRIGVLELMMRRESERETVWFELAVAMLDHKLPRPALSESDWEDVKAEEYGGLLRRVLLG